MPVSFAAAANTAQGKTYFETDLVAVIFASASAKWLTIQGCPLHHFDSTAAVQSTTLRQLLDLDRFNANSSAIDSDLDHDTVLTPFPQRGT